MGTLIPVIGCYFKAAKAFSSAEDAFETCEACFEPRVGIDPGTRNSSSLELCLCVVLEIIGIMV